MKGDEGRAADRALRARSSRAPEKRGDSRAFREACALDGSERRHVLAGIIATLGGVDATLTALYGEMPGEDLAERFAWVVREEQASPVRCWAWDELALCERTSEVMAPLALESLGDPAWGVSRRASQWLRDHPAAVPGSILRAVAGDPCATRERQLWTLFALLYRGEEAQGLFDGIPDLRIRLAGPVPAEVRAAIVRDVALSRMEPGTDVRWMIEACVTGAVHDAYHDEEGFLARLPGLYAALEEEGLSRGEAVWYESLVTDATAAGNFAVLPVDDVRLRLSVLGPFACLEGAAPSYDPRIRRAVAVAGLSWLEPEALETELTGLVVRHYGVCRPWKVGEYLHAWGYYRG